MCLGRLCLAVFMQEDRGGDERFGPVGRAGEVGGRGDFPAFHFQQKDRARALALGRIALGGIVINPQVVDERQETDEIFPAACPAFADFFRRDVVSAVRDAAPHAAKVEVRAFQSAEPYVDPVSAARGMLEESRDGLAAEGGFEPVVRAACDGLLEQRFADLPGLGVGDGERDGGEEFEDFLRDGVGVEERIALLLPKPSRNAAVASRAGWSVSSRIVIFQFTINASLGS